MPYKGDMNDVIVQTVPKNAENIVATLVRDDLVGSLIASLILIAGLLLIRSFIFRLLKRKAGSVGPDMRRTLTTTRNMTLVLIIIGLFFIWFPQIHSFALSITAVAVAVVVATKEIIQCLLGSLLRTSVQPFKVGDWIRIDNVAGEVVDTDLFTTTLHEVDLELRTYQFTGRSIKLPNAKFFTVNVENYNFLKNFMIHDIAVTVPNYAGNPSEALARLGEIAETLFQPYRKDAVSTQKKANRKNGIEVAEVEPSLSLSTSNLGHVIFGVRVFVPTREVARLDAEIKKRFLQFIYESKQEAGAALAAEAKADAADGGDDKRVRAAPPATSPPASKGEPAPEERERRKPTA